MEKGPSGPQNSSPTSITVVEPETVLGKSKQTSHEEPQQRSSTVSGVNKERLRHCTLNCTSLSVKYTSLKLTLKKKKKSEKLEEIRRNKLQNTVWDPGLGPATEKGNSGKTGEIRIKLFTFSCQPIY